MVWGLGDATGMKVVARGMDQCGGAVVIKPSGAIAAGPLNREKGILFADVDAGEACRAFEREDSCLLRHGGRLTSAATMPASDIFSFGRKSQAT